MDKKFIGLLLLCLFCVGFGSAEYYVDIYADSVTGATGGVTVTDLGGGVFRVNATNGNYEIDRALVMKWLFYGTSGSDPRATSTYMDNVTNALSIDTRDTGKRGNYASFFHPTTYAISSYTGTFTDTSTNIDCSSWSYLDSTGGLDVYINYETPDGTILNNIPLNTDTTIDETGTDRSADEKDNPADTQIIGHARSGESVTGRVIYVCSGNISWVTTGTATTSNTDFYLNESFPEFQFSNISIQLNSPEDNFEELLDTNITFNITSISTGRDLVNISLYINGTLNETKSISGTEDTETFTKSFSILGNYNWSVEVCNNESICSTSETREFEIVAVKESNLVYDLNITEGESTTFSVQPLLASGYSLDSAILRYNGTNYTTTVVFIDGNYSVFSTITAPLVESDTNLSFNFFFVVDGVTYEQDSNNQTVLDIVFDVCGGASNDTLLNISLFDEELLSILTGNIELNADITSKSSGSVVETLNATFNNTHSGAICFSPTDSYNLYYLDLEIRYWATGYVTELYHIQSADMADYPSNLSLFPLSQNDSTEFIVTYKNNNFILTPGAVIQLQRKYIGEDVFRTVEAPLTSSDGTTVLHIDLNTNKYRVSVVQDGETLDFFDNVIFSCENELAGDCTYLLDGAVNPNNDIPIEDLTDFSYSITLDEDNQTITVLFSVPSGTSSSVNVLLEQLDMFGNITSCNTTVVTSAGSIECSYTDSIEKSLLELTITKDDIQQAVLGYVNDPDLDMDGVNFFIVFLFTISLVGMAISSPEWMAMIAVMVLVISGTLLLVKGVNLVMGLGMIAWILIAAAIIIYKLAKQEDR